MQPDTGMVLEKHSMARYAHARLQISLPASFNSSSVTCHHKAKAKYGISGSMEGILGSPFYKRICQSRRRLLFHES